MSEFKYDLHVHTAETSSCAKVNSQTLVQMYKEAGYSGVVITDHYFKDYFDAIDVRPWEDKVRKFLTGYKLAKEEGDRIGLRIILGMEIRFLENKNDYLIYGLDESFLHNYKELYSLGITNFSMLTKDKGILIFQAHPFRRGLVTANLSDIHGIEVYNGSKKHFSNNDKANKFAEANNIKKISGSDFHQIEDLARGGIILNKEISCSKELVGTLKESNAVELIMSK